MAVTIKVATNVKAVRARIQNIAGKQVPYATAMAMNKVMREVVPELKLAEKTNLDRPRPFTMNAIRVIPARKAKLEARIVMMDLTAAYLQPYEFGGLNKLNSKVLLKPIAEMSNLDQFGNLPKRRMAQLKGRKDVFVGKIKTKAGEIYGVWQRYANEKQLSRIGPPKMNPKTGKLVNFSSPKGANLTGRLKLLIKFTDAHPARQRIHWFDTAKKVIDQRYLAAFDDALDKALAKLK